MPGRPAAPTRFVSGDRVLRCFAEGTTGESTVVMVHGIGLAASIFGRLAPLLAVGRRVLRVELPGFGGTPKPERPLSMSEHADLLAAHLRRAGEGPVVLVGHSMGCIVVSDLAARHPDLVSRVVLLGPVTDPAARSSARSALRFALDAVREPLATNAMVVACYLRTGLRWYLRSMPDMLGYDLERTAGVVPHPVLILHGRRDPISPRAWCVRLADAFPDARLAEIDGASHLAMHSRPRQVAAAIEDFARHPAPR